MPSAGFEPAIPASERPLSYTLDGAATGIGLKVALGSRNMQSFLHFSYYSYEGWNFNSGNYLFTTDTK